jgi:NAD(P)-dependent dehydrogenase (short-subunit alcohol dehydrogenase family)
MKQLFDINVHGVFFTARESARIMAVNGGGSVVLIASMSAHIVNYPQVRGSQAKTKIKKTILTLS